MLCDKKVLGKEYQFQAARHFSFGLQALFAAQSCNVKDLESNTLLF